MRKGGGPKKGSAYEREICKKLSLWWTGNKDDDVFWRTQASGARATIRAKQGKKLRGQVGDVSATDGRGKRLCQAFTISIKRGYKDCTMQDILDVLENRKEPVMLGWIKECIQHCQQAETLAWMLVVKRNQRKTMVLFPGYIRMMLEGNCKKKLDKCRPQVNMLAKIEGKRIMNIVAMGFDDFLASVSRQDIRMMVLNA